MNIAIVGSRNYPNKQQVFEYVNGLPDDTIVVSGGAPGVDSWAEYFARQRGLGVLVFGVPRGHHLTEPFAVAAKARNTKIIEHADSVTAFWDGTSPGTKDSIAKALQRRKPLLIYTPQWVEQIAEFTTEDFERILSRIKR